MYTRSRGGGFGEPFLDRGLGSISPADMPEVVNEHWTHSTSALARMDYAGITVYRLLRSI